MIGRSLSRLIASTTCWVKAPPLVLTPISTVGLSASMVSTRSLRRRRRVRVHLLGARQIGAGRLQQPVDVEHGDAARASSLREPLPLHGGDDETGDADAGRARAQEQDPLAVRGASRICERRRQPREGDAGRALDVVVVAERPVAVPIEQPDRVGALPVLEVDAAAREDLLDRLRRTR